VRTATGRSPGSGAVRSCSGEEGRSGGADMRWSEVGAREMLTLPEPAVANTVGRAATRRRPGWGLPSVPAEREPDHVLGLEGFPLERGRGEPGAGESLGEPTSGR